MIYSQSREKTHLICKKRLLSDMLFLNWNSDMQLVWSVLENIARVLFFFFTFYNVGLCGSVYKPAKNPNSISPIRTEPD